MLKNKLMLNFNTNDNKMIIIQNSFDLYIILKQFIYFFIKIDLFNHVIFISQPWSLSTLSIPELDHTGTMRICKYCIIYSSIWDLKYTFVVSFELCKVCI